jgi:ABC-2 type transport system permease protein
LIAPYVEFAKKAFTRESTYRVEVFSNIGSLIFRVYLMRSLWTALYAHNAAPPNIPLHAMITYATIALLMSLVLEVDGTRSIHEKLRQGSIATDLMRPINLPLSFFSDGFGMTLFHAFTILPSLLFALFLVHIDVPNPAAMLAFALSFALGYVLNSLINFLMNMVAFWTLETFALQLMVRWTSDLLSGQLLPLTFFPGFLGNIVQNLPFAAIYSAPLRIYIGDLSPKSYAATFETQVFWILVSGAVAAFIWSRAQRHIVVQGG